MEKRWQKEYIEFAQTNKGCALSDDQARSQWQAWVEELSGNPDKLFHDHIVRCVGVMCFLGVDFELNDNSIATKLIHNGRSHLFLFSYRMFHLCHELGQPSERSG